MSLESIRTLTKEVAEQNESVPLFRKTDTPHLVAEMIVEESIELFDEIQKAFLTDDLTQVAGEIGDVIFLALKLCDGLGLNADEVVRMKIKRNAAKYGGQSDKYVAKTEWEERGGDAIWYQAYLLASFDHENEPT